MRDIRKNYNKSELQEDIILPDPVLQFQLWFDEAIEAKVLEANAMILSTCDEVGVDSRVVLLKGIEEENFLFYTNYNSRKGIQLEKNSACSLVFLWLELERQVRIKGRTVKLAPEISDQYFQSRPRESQIGAWVSEQSLEIISREILENKFKELNKEFEGKTVPRPEHWGGYAVLPNEIEFWQGRPNRLHDRIRYSKTANAWECVRLQP